MWAPFCRPPTTRHPEFAQNAVRAASTHVCTLYVPADNSVRVYELVEAQLKHLITLPTFSGSPFEIVMDAARCALFVRDYNKEEVCTSTCDGGTWTAWRQLTRSHTDKLYIYCMCMPTPNILLLLDGNSRSVKQYELA